MADPLLRKTMLNVVRSIRHLGVRTLQPTAVPVVIVWNYTNHCTLQRLHCHQNSRDADEGTRAPPTHWASFRPLDASFRRLVSRLDPPPASRFWNMREIRKTRCIRRPQGGSRGLSVMKTPERTNPIPASMTGVRGSDKKATDRTVVTTGIKKRDTPTRVASSSEST